MSVDRDELFRELEPPAGGAERFRRRLEGGAAPPRGNARRWRPAAAVSAASAIAAVLVVAALVILPRLERGGADPDPDAERVAAVYDARQFDRLLGRPLEPAGPTVTLDERAATVSEIESTHEKVRIYQLE